MLAAFFIFIGTLWDVGTWRYSKNIQIFDDEKEEKLEGEKTVNIKLQSKEDDLKESLRETHKT